jgi:hypothetical protein
VLVLHTEVYLVRMNYMRTTVSGVVKDIGGGLQPLNEHHYMANSTYTSSELITVFVILDVHTTKRVTACARNIVFHTSAVLETHSKNRQR